ncbi:MAG: thiopurine S-methyltransferase [Deltaproteobacteria bacterium]|nr:thiopurine S-methyltransferase [Deltaproteobacteria bacterium]
MEKSFWEERWAAGQTAFHLADVNPRLAAHVESLGDKGTVLVPLCGKTLDMTFLAARGFSVVGVEFVEDAAQAYFAEAGVIPARVERHGWVGYHHLNVMIWVADMLAVTSELVGPVDAIYDRAAVVALPETLREGYARRLAALSHPGTKLLLVTFEHDLPSGPPFSVEPDVVQALYGDAFDVALIERVDALGDNERFKQRGGTRFHESVWVGQRR